jgi:mRNA-degrading endonuclease YafQ of YafQ-DinJ toxin-antitoxin module
MIKVAFDPSFRRAFKRKIDGNPERKRHFRNKHRKLHSHPFDRSLRTHRLSGKLKDYWSFSVEYDLRVIFYFAEKDRAVFIDIGSPREVY